MVDLERFRGTERDETEGNAIMLFFKAAMLIGFGVLLAKALAGVFG